MEAGKTKERQKSKEEDGRAERKKSVEALQAWATLLGPLSKCLPSSNMHAMRDCTQLGLAPRDQTAASSHRNLTAKCLELQLNSESPLQLSIQSSPPLFHGLVVSLSNHDAVTSCETSPQRWQCRACQVSSPSIL